VKRINPLVLAAFLAIALAAGPLFSAFRFDTLETKTADWIEEAAPSVSATGRSRIYMDSTTHKLRLSQNAGAFADILTNATAALTGLTLTTPTVANYLTFTEIAAPSVSGAGTGRCYEDSTTHLLTCSFNGASYLIMARMSGSFTQGDGLTTDVDGNVVEIGRAHV